MTRVSIKNIADRLGVSSATVSLVLNGKGEKLRISKEVAEKVRKIADELNYRPNMAARSLRTGKTRTLGLIVADISNPFFAKLARYIENIAGEKGYQVMFGSSDESAEKFGRLLDLFIEKNVDGIIMAPPQNSEAVVKGLMTEKIPFVQIDRGIEGVPISSVQINNELASYALTGYLIEQGCRKIAFVAYNMGLPNISKRCTGYRKALRDYGIEVNDSLVRSASYERFEEGINDAIDELLDVGIDSIVFATNRVGIQSLIHLKERKKMTGLQFVSIDYTDEYALSDIPITCIEQPIGELGERALNILFRYIDDPSYNVIEQVILQAKICK
ncbi:LacI family DNA-binding transcriptional regulator [Coprobacter tertius]|uniref:LacI family transcriptional regulator n=1 Tax=Coprobacter tertius TaxID=2944915 RepID=A0ABT1MHU7_9BACT|nr:LacI family DNA-binding transcriptional regulator [Coprobacter tertius]MCP9611954.1 LacI family transcriptional regulator [Coprobacter tertius]